MTDNLQELGLASGTHLDVVRVRGAIAGSIERRRSTHFQIIWVEQGHGLCDVDFVPHPLGPNRIFVLAPGQVFVWGDADFEGRAFLFEPAMLNREARDRLMFGSGLFLPLAPRPHGRTCAPAGG